METQKASLEQMKKSFEYEQIYNEGMKWKNKFNDGFMFKDSPQEEPYWMPTIILNSGKLTKSSGTMYSAAMENCIKYL